MEHKEALDAIASQLEKFMTTKTVVGEPISVGNVTLVPIQAVSFGFGSGGSEGKAEKGSGTGGGAGAGAKLRPMAIVAVKDGDVQVFNLGNRTTVEVIAEKIPELIEKLKRAKTEKEDKEEKDKEPGK